jgi:hypothetical protein
MSCGYGTPGFQCDKVYTLGDRVTPQRAQEIYDLGQRLGFTDFNPTSVDWDSPITSAHTRPRAEPQASACTAPCARSTELAHD